MKIHTKHYPLLLSRTLDICDGTDTTHIRGFIQLYRISSKLIKKIHNFLQYLAKLSQYANHGFIYKPPVYAVNKM